MGPTTLISSAFTALLNCPTLFLCSFYIIEQLTVLDKSNILFHMVQDCFKVGVLDYNAETAEKAVVELSAENAFAVVADVSKQAEVAAAVSFLAGPDSNYITGQTVIVDGGMQFH